jgi:Replication-relaxation
MVRGRGLSLTAGMLTGLVAMHKYRILAIPQFARISGVSYKYAAAELLDLERRGIIGYLGYTSLPGQGKTPKVYFLTRRGFAYLANEMAVSTEEVKAFREVSTELAWTPQMYHRLRILDCFIALELAVREQGHLAVVDTKLEYRRRKGAMERETPDYVDDREMAENRIVPDGAFVLENLQTGRRGLFLLEMDMGTERITFRASRDKRATIRGKFEQYDRYLKSGRFAAKYADWGDFSFCTILFVTLTWDRIENIRAAVSDLPQKLHPYYRLTTLDAAVNDFVGAIWKSRNVRDSLSYALVQQP